MNLTSRIDAGTGCTSSLFKKAEFVFGCLLAEGVA